MLEEGLLKDKQAMRQKLKVRNQFEAWPGGTFCLFLLHHRECFVLLNPQVIKSGGEKELLARGRRSNYDAPIKAEQQFQLSRKKFQLSRKKRNFTLFLGRTFTSNASFLCPSLQIGLFANCTFSSYPFVY